MWSSRRIVAVRRGIWAGLLVVWLLSGVAAQESGPGPSQAVPQSPPRKVPIKRIVVSGVDGIAPELRREIHELVKAYVGRQLSLADLQELTAELNALFRERGFMLAQAVLPAQAIAAGSVEIVVLQGKVGQVLVEGNETYSSDFLKARLGTAIAADGILMSEPFYRAVLLLNELPDLEVKTVLKPGGVKGTTDVVLQVSDSLPVHGGLSYNNFGTPQTSTHRFGASFSAGNLLAESDLMTISGNFGTPFDRVGVFQGAYSFPVNLEGTRMGLLYSNSAFTVGQELEILDIRGRANIFGLTLAHPTVRSLDRSDDLSLALFYKDILNTFAGGIPFGKDVYGSMRLGYSMDLRDLRGRTIIQPALTQGLGGNAANDPLSSRLGATGTFTRLNLDVVRVQVLGTQTYGLLRFSGQLAADPLFVSEELALGGPDSVRGFAQSEFLGDLGYQVTAELNYSPLEEDPETDWSERQLLQLAAFVDHGSAWRLNSLPGEIASRTLTGAGVGLRLGIFENAQLRLDLGFPIAGAGPLDPTVIPYAQVQTTF
jgi:hemolysin activation/secretion protein